MARRGVFHKDMQPELPLLVTLAIVVWAIWLPLQIAVALV
jgi:hypothetical protein